MNGFIYLAHDRLNGMNYVGQTVKSLKVRQRQHECNDNGIRFHNALHKRPETFKWVILETIPVKDLNHRECLWIWGLNTMSPNGYNLTEGGEGMKSPTEETKAKMSASHMGRCPTEETRAKMSASRMGQCPTEETKAKLRAANKGNPKIIAALKGNTNAPGRKRGFHHTEETKAKMSASQKQRHRKIK